MKTNINKKTLMNITAILHDTGKMKTFKQIDNMISFVGHEDESLKIADKFLNNLKFSNDDKKYIETLIKYHMIIHRISDMTDEKIQREQLANIYIEIFEDAELLHDCIEFTKRDSFKDLSVYEKLQEIVKEFSKEPALIKGKEVEGYPDAIKGKLIKRMRFIQLSKKYNKEQLLKIIKSEANNIISNNAM
jgi:hypothetical protein